MVSVYLTRLIVVVEGDFLHGGSPHGGGGEGTPMLTFEGDSVCKCWEEDLIPEVSPSMYSMRKQQL